MEVIASSAEDQRTRRVRSDSAARIVHRGLLLTEGMNLAEVKELMKHEDVKTIMKNLHPNTSGQLLSSTRGITRSRFTC
jgi:hypothetical protein